MSGDNVFDTFKKGFEDLDTSLDELNKKSHSLGDVTELVNKRLALETQVAELVEKTNLLNQELEVLNSKTIPDKMAELGLSKVVTDSGAEVTVGKIYRGSLVKYAEYALKWFIVTKQADSIKNSFTVSLGVGDSKKATDLKQVLSAAGFNYNNKQDIAWNTLAGIIKELETQNKLQDNTEWNKLQSQGLVPRDLSLREALGVFTKYETKLKFKK